MATAKWRFDPDLDTGDDDAWFFEGCIYDEDGGMVAWLTLDQFWGAKRTEEETQRNGQLIAAAPLLLETLKALEWKTDDQCPDCFHYNVMGHTDHCKLNIAIKATEIDERKKA